jgi:hypothetical protein
MSDGKTKNLEAVDKELALNSEWQNWSRTSAGDNFQRADIVPGYESLLKDYALAQMGKPGGTMSAKAAVQKAYDDLIGWGHKQVHVGGRTLDMKSDKYPGTAMQTSVAIQTAINNLDISQLDFKETFHANFEMGHTAARDEAMRSMLATKVFPHHIDENTFSLYERGQANDFQLRGKDGKPIVMNYKYLPTITWTNPGVAGWRAYQVAHPNEPRQYRGELIQTNWPTINMKSTRPDVDEYMKQHPEVM